MNHTFKLYCYYEDLSSKYHYRKDEKLYFLYRFLFFINKKERIRVENTKQGRTWKKGRLDVWTSDKGKFQLN